MARTAAPDPLAALRRYRRATNYLAAAQVYLQANALLREPLTAEHIEPRLPGHWRASLVIVFTGGIGERSAAARQAVVARLGPLGVAGTLWNAPGDDALLTPTGASVTVLRIAAREDLVIARETARILAH